MQKIIPEMVLLRSTAILNFSNLLSTVIYYKYLRFRTCKKHFSVGLYLESLSCLLNWVTNSIKLLNILDFNFSSIITYFRINRNRIFFLKLTPVTQKLAYEIFFAHLKVMAFVKLYLENIRLQFA